MLEKQTVFKREEQEREMELLRLLAETGVRKSEMGNKSLRPNLPKVEEQKDDMRCVYRTIPAISENPGLERRYMGSKTGLTSERERA